MQPFNIAAGDFDKDNHDELVMMSGGTFFLYSVDSDLNPNTNPSKRINTKLQPGQRCFSCCWRYGP